MPVRDILKRSIVKDTAALFSSNVWTQALSLAAYLLLTRLFSKEDFGLYNVFYSYVEIFIILSTCKYELSIVVAPNDREAAAVSRLSLRLNAIVSTLLLLTVVLIHYLLPDSRFADVVGRLSIGLLLPLMVFFCGTTRIYASLFNRFRGFKQIAYSEVITSTSGVALKILFGLTRPLSFLHGIGLPLGTVLGKMAGNINYLLRMRRLPIPRDITRSEIRGVAAKYRNYPLFSTPKEFLNSFSYNLPFLWLALYCDKAEIGLFGLALTCVLKPVNLLNTVFEKVLYVRVSEKVRDGKPIFADLWRFVKYLNLVALPCLALLFFFAEPVFTFLFGAKWAGCGFYVRCLVPWVMVSVTSTSLVFLANVFSRQRVEFLFYGLLFLLRLAAVGYGVFSGNMHLSVLLFSLSGMLVSLFLLVWCLGLARKHDRAIR